MSAEMRIQAGGVGGQSIVTMSHPPYSVAVLTSHPIQYQAPLFRALTETGEVDLRVLFCSSYGVGSHVDKVFGTEFVLGHTSA